MAETLNVDGCGCWNERLLSWLVPVEGRSERLFVKRWCWSFATSSPQLLNLTFSVGPSWAPVCLSGQPPRPDFPHTSPTQPIAA